METIEAEPDAEHSQGMDTDQSIENDGSTVRIHFCGPDMSQDDNFMCNDELSEIPMRYISNIVDDTSLPKQSQDNFLKSNRNKDKRKTINFGERGFDFLYDDSAESPQRRLSYCKRIKLKAKFNVWNKLMQIQSSSSKKSEVKTQIEELFFEKVNEGAVEDVKALLQFGDDDKLLFKFDRNAVDQQTAQSALTIAITEKNLNMCKVLLNNKVSLKDGIFHAIDQNFVEGVKLLLKYDKCYSICIPRDHSYFQIGMTPLTLAALKNNYTILKILTKNGHVLKDTLNFNEGIQHCWESRILRKLHWMTESSPAYITLICEESGGNALDYSMDLIETLRKHAKTESELREFYKTLTLQVEEFMCHLLDQIQSSADLSDLFEYQYLRSAKHKYSIVMGDEKGHLNILERACSLQLFKFVNHGNCQLALSYLIYRNAPFLRDGNVTRRFVKRTIIGLLFPIWSLFYLFAPQTKLGKIMKIPSILFECYTMSSFAFLAILILNILTKSVDNVYLGAPPTAFEYLIGLWMLGKWVEEMIECHNRGFVSYIRDWWNWSDLMQLFLFSAWCILRIVDYAQHQADEVQVFQIDWSVSEPRLWSVAVLAYGYVLVFLRVLGFTRTNRVLGPLRISFSKMMVDVIQFFAFFFLIMFAFGIGLSELFWYYGSVQNGRVLCSLIGNSTELSIDDCQTVPFSNLWSSLVNLFWGIFGYLEPTQLDFTGKHTNIEALGQILLAVFYIAVILILINMLIAIMSKSYEITSANEEEEWRFYRAVIWVRYIRGDFTSPPPMNLIPNFRYIWKKLHEYWRKRRDANNPEPVGSEHVMNEAELELSTTSDASSSYNLTERDKALEFWDNKVMELTKSVTNKDSTSKSCETCKAPLDILTKHTNALVHRYKLHKLLGTAATVDDLLASELL